MTPEHKQQAKQLIADWTNVSRTSTPAVWFLNGDCMAGFLQELVDAPEPEPVARVTGYYAGHATIITLDGRVLPAGTALYTAPPHQSEHHLEMVNTPAPSVPDAELVTVPRELLGAACYAIKKNLPAPKILEQLRRYALGGVTAPPAPSVPDGWRSAIAKEFPLFDEDGLDEDKHCCEWVMLQERKRLHKMIASTPTPAEAPADVARDAERYRWLRDKCRATGEHWGGRWSLVIEGPCPDGDKSSGAIDKAIDAAIKRQGGE